MTEFEELVITSLVTKRAVAMRSAHKARLTDAEEAMPPDDKFMEDAIQELLHLRKFVMPRLLGHTQTTSG